jgi:hypothetical protein
MWVKKASLEFVIHGTTFMATGNDNKTQTFHMAN